MAIEQQTRHFPVGGRSSRSKNFGLALIASLVLVACGASPESMVNSAKEYLGKNDLNAATIQLKNALQAKPDLGEARYLLGKINLEQGDVGGAVKNLRRAVDAGYQTDAVWGALARALATAGEGDALLKEFDGKAMSDPVQKAYVLAALGDVKLSKGRREDAADDYRTALNSDPNNIRALAGTARLKAIDGDLLGALADLDNALAQPISYDQAEVYSLKAAIFLAQNRPDDAVVALEGAVRAKPDAVAVHFTLVSLLIRQNKQELARERLADMRKVVGNHPATLYLQSFTDFRAGKLLEAKDEIEKVVRIAPDFLPGRLLAGSIYLRLNEQLQAQANLQKVLEQVPGQSFARKMMVASLLATKDVAKAEETLKPLLQSASAKNDPVVLGLAGQVYLAKGDFDRSSDYFERVVHADPNNAKAMTRLGVAKLAGGETQEAFEDLESASKLDANSVQADIAIILAHLRRGELDKALAAQAAMEKKQPENPQTYNLKGGVLMAKKDLPAAKAAFEKALAIQPSFLPAVVNLVRIDMVENRPEEAKNRFEKVISSDPKLIAAYLGLAELQARTSAPPTEIEATLKRALVADSGSVSAKLALARFYLGNNMVNAALVLAQEASLAAADDPAALELLGRSQMAAGDIAQGINTLKKLVNLMPQSPQPSVELADAYIKSREFSAAERSLKRALELKADYLPAQQRLVAIYLRDKREDAALELARNIQKQRSNAAIGFGLEGDVQASRQKWSDAVASYRKAYQLGKSAQVLTRLHTALVRSGRSAEADRLVEEWMRANPNDLVVLGYLADRALVNNKPGDAVKYYESILKRTPKNAQILNNLAYAAGQVGDPRALGFAAEAIALAPDNPAILDTYGMLLVKSGDVAKGLAQLEKAKAVAPSAYAIRINLAQAYVTADRKADARRELESVMTEAKDEPLVRSRVETLLKTL